MKTLIIGANSDIAFECLKLWARIGYELYPAVRNEAEFRARIESESIQVKEIISYDALDAASIEMIIKACPSPDLALLAHGVLEPKICGGLSKLMTINFESLAFIAEHYAEQMAKKGKGSILGIGSVAGLRGRASNYAYGASKAALHTFLSGLRNKYGDRGVQVCTIMPGPVQTKMLEGAELKTSLIADPEKVAKDIDRALRRTSTVVYTPWYWRYIMLIIRSIPEFIFKKMKL